jgi:hypothetical protein
VVPSLKNEFHAAGQPNQKGYTPILGMCAKQHRQLAFLRPTWSMGREIGAIWSFLSGDSVALHSPFHYSSSDNARSLVQVELETGIIA